MLVQIAQSPEVFFRITVGEAPNKYTSIYPFIWVRTSRDAYMLNNPDVLEVYNKIKAAISEVTGPIELDALHKRCNMILSIMTENVHDLEVADIRLYLNVIDDSFPNRTTLEYKVRSEESC